MSWAELFFEIKIFYVKNSGICNRVKNSVRKNLFCKENVGYTSSDYYECGATDLTEMQLKSLNCFFHHKINLKIDIEIKTPKIIMSCNSKDEKKQSLEMELRNFFLKEEIWLISL